jgi:3-oxoacyl-[acyl-carrier protein] reductase
LKLEDKVVLITGASRGIGKEIAREFIYNGAVVIAIATNNEELEDSKKELGENKYIPYKCDITNIKEVEEVIKDIINKFEKIDVLINNAGIVKDNFLMIMKEEEFDSVINVNLKGTFLVTKFVSKFMRKRKEGNIINISSIVGIDGNVGQTNYSATKAGVIGFTKSWAKELTLKGENIRVNAVAPGFIKTQMTDNLKDEFKEAVIQKCCIKRLGLPEDIAKLCLFLASEDSAYITGQVIRIDGGLTI